MWRSASGGSSRDNVENVMNKSVSETTIVAYRNFSTGDNQQDTVFSCTRDFKWTWDLGTIIHNTASDILLQDDSAYTGNFIVFAACAIDNNATALKLLMAVSSILYLYY